MGTLYTTALSANGRKALAAVRHLALDLEVVEVNVYRGEGQSAAYRALNPLGKIPTLVDGDFVLWESNAILAYLSDAYGGGALLGKTARERADVLRWMFWEGSHWQPALIRVLAPRVGQVLFSTPGEPVTPPWDDAELGVSLRLLGSVLQSRRFVCGDEISAADFAVAGMTTYFGAAGFPEEAHPSIAAWLRRMDDLPAWASTAVAPWSAGAGAM